MAKKKTVIIVENEITKRESIEGILIREGYEVHAIQGGKLNELTQGTVACIREISVRQDGQVDALILDIKFDDHILGGVELYTALVANGLAKKCRHVLIVTVYQDLRGQEHSAVTAMMRRYGIPHDNIVSKKVQRATKILALLEKLIGS